MNFFYEKEGLCLVLGESTIRYFSQGQVLSELTQDGAVLYGCDAAKSVIRRLHASNATSLCYTPYGHLAKPFAKGPALRFKNAHYDPMISAYALGRGYRFFSPSLMRFQTPDAHSPFGQGGLNSYAFCLGDPVNYSDPTGQWGERITGFLRRLGRDRKPPYMSPETHRNVIEAQRAYENQIDIRRYIEERTEARRAADVAHGFVMENAHVYPVMKGILKHLPESYASVIPGNHPRNMAEMLVKDIATNKEHIAYFAGEIARISKEIKSNPELYRSPQSVLDQMVVVNRLNSIIQETLGDIRNSERNLSWLRRLS